MTDLPLHEVHLLQANYGHFVSASDCDISVLSITERNNADRLHSSDHRRQYLLTKALVRYVLAGYLQIEPQNIQFRFNAYGKPFLQHSTNIEFNVSHARDLLLIAVRRSAPIGVDLEYIDVPIDLLGVSATVFAPQELAALTDAPTNERTELFFRTWVQKEAYIKALGVGFSAPTTEIDTGAKLAHANVDPTGKMLTPDNVSDWLCWTFEPHAGYLAALVTGSDNLTLHQFTLTPRSMFS